MIKCVSGDISLVFDEKRGMILSLKHPDFEYISAPVPVLEASVMDKCGKRKRFSCGKLSLISCKVRENGFSAVYENDILTAHIGVSVGDKIEWSLKISISPEYTVEWANYPCITVPNTLSKEPSGHKILWGFNEGVLLDNLEDRENTYSYIEPDYPSEGLAGIFPGAVETQMMAYFNDKDGLYFAAHDAGCCLKGVDFYRSENGGIFLQFRHFCGAEFGECYEMPYPMVMEFFRGGWECAADIYKSWFEASHNWTGIADDTALPDWYHQSPVVITYPVRGRCDTDDMAPNRLFPYMNAMPHIERLEKELCSPIMVLLMHWEGTAPWAPPYVWPPFGGEKALSEFVQCLHSRGDFIGVYCSGIGWTLKSKLADYSTEKEFSEKNLAGEMCISPEGKLPFSKICTGQRVGYDLCPARQFTSDVINEQVSHMASAGLDYIQLLDQNHGGNPYFCYGRNHGHPPTPGKWEAEAMISMLSKIRKKYPDVLLGCESAAGESYIPYLKFSDNRFNLNYPIGRQVPLYAYIYHKYVNNFMGNQVCTNNILRHGESPDNTLERIAYAFSAGDFITLVLNENGEIQWNWGAEKKDGLPEQQPIKTLTKNLNEWRRGKGKKYLHTGDMAAPFEVVCGCNKIERGWCAPDSRPEIHTSAWKSGKGTFGQFLINYNKKETACTVCLPEGRFKITKQSGEELFVSGGKTEFSVAPLGACLIETECD